MAWNGEQKVGFDELRGRLLTKESEQEIGHKDERQENEEKLTGRVLGAAVGNKGQHDREEHHIENHETAEDVDDDLSGCVLLIDGTTFLAELNMVTEKTVERYAVHDKLKVISDK